MIFEKSTETFCKIKVKETCFHSIEIEAQLHKSSISIMAKLAQYRDTIYTENRLLVG